MPRVRVILILPLLAALLAWTLAFGVAGARDGRATLVAEAVVGAVEPRAAEGDEPLALIAPTVFPTPTPPTGPALATTARAQTVPRVTAADRARYAAIIEAAAVEFGQDPAFLVRVAMCESSLDPAAVGGHGELGILQFKPPTFARNGARLGYTLADVWDVRAQARVAAEMFGRQQQWQWSCAKKVG